MNAQSSVDYGVGARFSVAVMADDYADIILTALAEADSSGLEVTTDDVSTHVSGTEDRILAYIGAVIAGCARSGHHVSVHLLLSRGCPGELACELPPDTLAQGAEPPQLPVAGITAAAHWSLYPLQDGADGDHMRHIYAAIEHARELGVEVRAEHYATRLDGDLNAVLQTLAAAWLMVGREVQHVVSHATLSLNSPTAKPGNNAANQPSAR